MFLVFIEFSLTFRCFLWSRCQAPQFHIFSRCRRHFFATFCLYTIGAAPNLLMSSRFIFDLFKSVSSHVSWLPSCNDSVVFIRVRVHSHLHVPSDVSASSYYESMIVGVLHHENILAIGVCVLGHPH